MTLLALLLLLAALAACWLFSGWLFAYNTPDTQRLFRIEMLHIGHTASAVWEADEVRTRPCLRCPLLQQPSGVSYRIRISSIP